MYKKVAQIGLQDLCHWKLLLRCVKRVDPSNECNLDLSNGHDVVR